MELLRRARPVAVLLALLVMPAHGLGSGAVVASSLSLDLRGAKNRPVTKVITLLKDMLTQLEKEAEEDEEIYDKIACWCATNDKEKTKAIAEAEAKIADLTSQIDELAAVGARLGTEIENLEKEVAKNQKSLDTATALREKQMAEFNEEEKDMIEAISALKAAIEVLAKHHSLLQVPHTQALTVSLTLSHQLERHADLLKGVLTHKQRRAVAEFLQAPEHFLQAPDYFDAGPTFKQAYQPQSGQIFGILTQMKETFENNLSAAQKEEMANQKAYEELKAAMEAQIAAATEQIDTKTQEKAEAEAKLANAKEDIEDTRATLSADEKFLMALKEKCQMTDQEWEERQKTRQLEMEAVSKALAILSSDDAHDLFTKTFNPEFLQSEKLVSAERRSKASELLSTVAQKLKNPRLSTLALRVRLDAFEKVKKAIDDMIAELQKQQEDEIKHKDFCVGEFNGNQLTTEKKEREKTDLEAKIEDLEMTIKTLTSDIEKLKAEIEEMQTQVKRAGEDREKENKDFQMTVADQRATQKLLQQALVVLKEFYDKAALIAVGAKQAPPEGFKEYKKSGAAGGVMGMIQEIINDAKAMEIEAIRGEEDAQKAYESFVKETNDSIDAANKSIVNKTEEKAKSEGALTQAEAEKEDLMVELEHLSNYNGELHVTCDFVLKNFEIRQTARREEIDALKQAKAILAGAKFEEFLQQ